MKKRPVKKDSEKPGTSKLQLPEKQQTVEPSTSNLPEQKRYTKDQRETSEQKVEKVNLMKRKQEKATTSRDRFSEEKIQRGSVVIRNQRVVWTKESRKWFPKKGELKTILQYKIKYKN